MGFLSRGQDSTGVHSGVGLKGGRGLGYPPPVVAPPRSPMPLATQFIVFGAWVVLALLTLLTFFLRRGSR
jgi:hypothetical protein